MIIFALIKACQKNSKSAVFFTRLLPTMIEGGLFSLSVRWLRWVVCFYSPLMYWELPIDFRIVKPRIYAGFYYSKVYFEIFQVLVTRISLTPFYNSLLKSHPTACASHEVHVCLRKVQVSKKSAIIQATKVQLYFLSAKLFQKKEIFFTENRI